MKVTDKMTPEEIDDAFADGKSVMDTSLKEQLQKAAKRTLKKVGGARPGAGRPTKEYKKSNLLFSPEARKCLEMMVQNKEASSLSEAANLVICGR